MWYPQSFLSYLSTFSFLESCWSFLLIWCSFVMNFRIFIVHLLIFRIYHHLGFFVVNLPYVLAWCFRKVLARGQVFGRQVSSLWPGSRSTINFLNWGPSNRVLALSKALQKNAPFRTEPSKTYPTGSIRLMLLRAHEFKFGSFKVLKITLQPLYFKKKMNFL